MIYVDLTLDSDSFESAMHAPMKDQPFTWNTVGPEPVKDASHLKSCLCESQHHTISMG